MKFQTQK